MAVDKINNKVSYNNEINYYNLISSSYDSLHQEEQQKKLAIIKTQLNIKKENNLLDVGCGSAFSANYFDCNFFGLDPSLNLLNLNKSKLNLINAFAESIPFKSDSFEFVISVTAIHNFHDVKKGILEMKRVGKNKFVFSILKKSSKLPLILSIIEQEFIIEKKIEEEHDVIYFCKKTNNFSI